MADSKILTTGNKRDLKHRTLDFLGEQGFIVIFVLWAIFLTFTTDSFATPKNIFTVLRQATIIGILAIGEHMIVLLGTMDVSLASILTLTGVAMAAAMVNFGLPPITAAILVLGIGALAGLINGLIVTKLKINPIITTMGMMSILEGLAFVYTQGKTIFGESIDTIKFLSQGKLINIIPVPVIVLFVLYGYAFFLLRKTVFGARIFAVGSNERATWLAGIDTDRVKLAAFVLAGVLAATGGIMQVARQGTATGGMGSDFLFPVLTAVVLGGASLSGGRGKVFNTLIAAIFLTTITNGMILLGISIYAQRIISGLILVTALSLDRLRTVRG
ncbi:MAG: ABC transporter permease [Anaerolineales bacterium]|nr:ABC transporter permease [Anaerolineales bacterium]